MTFEVQILSPNRAKKLACRGENLRMSKMRDQGIFDLSMISGKEAVIIIQLFDIVG